VAMAVREIDAADKRQLNDFIRMERKLVGHHPLFTCDLDSETRKYLSRESEMTKEMELAAFANDHARGVAIVSPQWQRDHDEPQTGFVGYFAAAPDAEGPTIEILDAAEDWLGRRGMTRVIAPYNGNAFLGMSALTDAFDERPMFPMPWSPPYYEQYLDAAGYSPAYPLWYYEVDFAYERYRDFTERALESPECTVREIDKRRWSEEVETLRVLWNEGFADEWEFLQYTPEQFSEFFKDLKQTFDSRTLLIAEVEGEPAGLVMGMPDLGDAFRAMRGRLGPIKLLRLMRAARRPSRIGLLGIAVRPAFRGRRIGATLAATLYRNLEGMGFSHSSYYLVNDANVQSRGLAEALGGQGRVLYHCFDKNI
jgi:GNAT superfamily N-acetyltransferase